MCIRDRRRFNSHVFAADHDLVAFAARCQIGRGACTFAITRDPAASGSGIVKPQRQTRIFLRQHNRPLGRQCHEMCIRDRPGDVFVALKGAKADGLSFVPVAVARRASCIVCEKREDAQSKCAGLPYAEVPDLHGQLGPIACLLYTSTDRHV